MAEHRVPMLRGHVDPAASRDPQVRRLVGALATLEIAPPPRAEFRAELRAQLVAVTPRLVAEGDAARDRVPAPKRRRLRLARPLAVAVGVLAVFIVLLGGAVLLSQNALPGDALYGIKRASENTRYGLTDGAVAKGTLKLDFATRRIDEVSELVPKTSGDTGTLVRQTLDSADGDVRAASRMLGTAAVQDTSPAPLDTMTGWAPGEIAKLDGIIKRIPAGALRTRVVATQDLIKAAEQRAEQLKADLGCGCLGSSGTDVLGPMPCPTACSAATPKVPGGTTTTAPAGTHSAGTHRAGSTHSAGSAPSTPPATKAGTTPADRGGASSSAAPQGGAAAPRASSTANRPTARSTQPVPPGLPLPTSTAPGLPINIGSCGVQASLAGIGVGIGGC
jgi:hypothetical protein